MLRIPLLSLLFLAMSYISFAQNVDELPLQVKISVEKTKKQDRQFCVTAEITNTSDREVVIDKNALGYAIAFSADNESFLSQGEVGGEYRGAFLVLSPRSSYREARKISLNDEFFLDDKEYQMSIIYGQFQETSFEEAKVWRGIVKSNKISFYLDNGTVIFPSVKMPETVQK